MHHPLAPSREHSGQLGAHRQSFDTDNSFIVVEIAGDSMFFEMISRTGRTVDSGSIARRKVTPGVSP